MTASHPRIDLLNVDCMEYMAGLPDKAFDLAIVDPPYGIGMDRKVGSTRKKHTQRVFHVSKEWDSAIPNAAYFDELRRVSCDQIVWGANYMTPHLPPSMGWVFWFKRLGGHFSDGEFAYTSFQRAAEMVSIWCETGDGAPARIHPTQKPVALYRWLLKNYAKPGQRILDTHGGSMSIAIACDIEGYDLTLCEIDRDYFEAGKRRLEQHRAQPRLFDPPKQTTEQLRINE